MPVGNCCRKCVCIFSAIKLAPVPQRWHCPALSPTSTVGTASCMAWKCFKTGVARISARWVWRCNCDAIAAKKHSEKRWCQRPQHCPLQCNDIWDGRRRQWPQDGVPGWLHGASALVHVHTGSINVLLLLGACMATWRCVRLTYSTTARGPSCRERVRKKIGKISISVFNFHAQADVCLFSENERRFVCLKLDKIRTWSLGSTSSTAQSGGGSFRLGNL